MIFISYWNDHLLHVCVAILSHLTNELIFGRCTYLFFIRSCIDWIHTLWQCQRCHRYNLTHRIVHGCRYCEKNTKTKVNTWKNLEFEKKFRNLKKKIRNLKKKKQKFEKKSKNLWKSKINPKNAWIIVISYLIHSNTSIEIVPLIEILTGCCCSRLICLCTQTRLWCCQWVWIRLLLLLHEEHSKSLQLKFLPYKRSFGFFMNAYSR